MFTRLIGAIIRAAMVLFVVSAPALLLPDVSNASLEITVLLGGVVAAFTLFEYASTHPGLIDFRFAPPYNRIRFLAFAMQIFSLVFLCRALEGEDAFSAGLIALSDQMVEVLTFPLSPVNVAAEMIAAGEDPTLVLLLARAAALSFFVTFCSLAFFALFLWLFRWPVGRRDFNLWTNLPTFEPGYGRDVERRLRRDGVINLLAGVAFLYALPVLLSRTSGWFDPSVFNNYQPLVWGVTIWAFVSGTLVIRGAAILKVGMLIRRSRGA
ncbi:MAG: hypothetical protein AAGI50_07690 [Pseudomonadota bacterium]